VGLTKGRLKVLSADRHRRPRREPNGVTLSLDERTLYVAASDGIFAYPVAANGDVGAGTRFSTVGGDGMVMDCAGNLYVASGTGVQILAPTTGAQVASIAVSGVKSVTNLAFGGADRKTLFISGQSSSTQVGLFQMGMNVPGMPY
jgi:gluconolactonase